MAKGKIENKWYAEIDPCFQENGEIRIVGSPINVAEQEQKVPRGGFEIAYMSALFEIFDRLGNQKMKVLKFILAHKDGMNCLNMTNTEIAEKVPCSRQTVVDTIKLLTEAGMVVRKGTVLRFNPHAVVKGNAQKEGYIMRKFIEEKEAL